MKTITIIPLTDIPLNINKEYKFKVLGKVLINNLQIEITCNSDMIGKSIKITPHGIDGYQKANPKEVKITQNNTSIDFSDVITTKQWNVSYLAIVPLQEENSIIRIAVKSYYDEKTHSISHEENTSTSTPVQKKFKKSPLHHVDFLSPTARQYKELIDLILKYDFIDEKPLRPKFSNWHVGISDNGTTMGSRQRAYSWHISSVNAVHELYNHYLHLKMNNVPYIGGNYENTNYLVIYHLQVESN